MGQGMIRKMKISAPVLFDANILMNFKGNLDFLFSFFENAMIHETVKNEVIDQSLNEELNRLSMNVNITFVSDHFPTDKVGKLLFEECYKELKDSFHIEDRRDLGECKTLLFAKFNNVSLISSQDTTVWTFITDSKYFKGIECLTIQDFSYFVYLNSKSKNDRKMAKSIYNNFTRAEHPFDHFKIFMERKKNEIPQYINFENNRMTNFEQLINDYDEFYNDMSYSNFRDIEYQIVKLAEQNTGTCLSCLYSRLDKNNVDYSIRKCLFNYSLGDEHCAKIREEFLTTIRKRLREYTI